MDTALTAWDLFVLRHQKPGNLAIHFISLVLFWGSPILAILLQNYWILIGFFVSGFVGGAGHYIFKDSHVTLTEATGSPRVVFYSTYMFVRIFTGRYSSDIAIARSKLKNENK